VGGFFTQVGAPPEVLDVGYVAAWDGMSWAPIGDGVSVGIHALTVYDGDLVAGGPLTEAGGQPALHIAQWNGSAWSDFDGGIDGLVNALTVFGGSLLVGGNFQNAGGAPSLRIARWDNPPSPVFNSLSPFTAGGIEASPNPFNPRVKISYALNSNALVLVTIYDIQGRIVRTLFNGPQTVGKQSVTWDGRDRIGREMPSGTYLYRVDTGMATGRGKITLAK
jgi:hypothetical protein